MDKESEIILTGNSYYTEFKNEKTDGSNLINGTYSWSKSNNSNDAIKIGYLYILCLLLLNGLLL